MDVEKNPSQTQLRQNQVSKIRALVIIVLGFILLAFGIGSGSYYLKNNGDTTAPEKAASDAKNQNTGTNSNEATTQNRTKDWKTFTSASRGISVKHPPTWVTTGDEFVSEESFTPGLQDKSRVFNAVEIQKFPEQIYSEFSNEDWFNKIFIATAPVTKGQEKITKIASGLVSSSERYVIFTSEPASTAKTAVTKQIKAHIIKGKTIYQLTLDMYDDYGLEIFKLMLPESSVN